MITEMIYQFALANGGVTYDMRRHRTVNDGYAVSSYPYAECKQQLTELNIQFFVSEHYALLRRDGHCLGLWFNAEDGEWYYDVVRVMINKSAAHRIAVQTNQIAYFDLKNGKEVRL